MRTLMILIMEYLRVFIVLFGFFGCTKSQIRHGKTIVFSQNFKIYRIKTKGINIFLNQTSFYLNSFLVTEDINTLFSKYSITFVCTDGKR